MSSQPTDQPQHQPQQPASAAEQQQQPVHKADLFRLAIQKRATLEEKERQARLEERERARQIEEEAGLVDGGASPDKDGGAGGRQRRPPRDKAKMSLRERVFAVKTSSQTALLVCEVGAPPRCAALLRYSGPRPQHSGTFMLRSLHVIGSETDLDLESESGPSCTAGMTPSRAMADISRNIEGVLNAVEQAPAVVPRTTKKELEMQKQLMRREEEAAAATKVREKSGDIDDIDNESSPDGPGRNPFVVGGAGRCDRLSLQLGTLLLATVTPGLHFPMDHPFVSLTDLFYEIETGGVRPFFLRDSAQAVRSAARRVCYSRNLLPKDDGARVIVQLSHPEGNVTDVFTFKINFAQRPQFSPVTGLTVNTRALAAAAAAAGGAALPAPEDEEAPEFELEVESVVRDGFHVQWLLHYLSKAVSHREDVVNTTAHGVDSCIQADFSGTYLSNQHPDVAKVKEAAERVVKFELQSGAVGNHTKSAAWLHKPYISQLTSFLPPVVPPELQAQLAALALAKKKAEAAAAGIEFDEDEEKKKEAAAAAAAQEEKKRGKKANSNSNGGSIKSLSMNDDDFGDEERGDDITTRRMSLEDVFHKRALIDDAIIQRVTVCRSETFEAAAAVKKQLHTQADPSIVAASPAAAQGEAQAASSCSGSFARAIQFELASCTSEPSPFDGRKHRIMRVRDNIVRSELRPFTLNFVPRDFATAEQNAAVFGQEVMTFVSELGMAIGHGLSQDRMAGWVGDRSHVAVSAPGGLPNLKPAALEIPGQLNLLQDRVKEAADAVEEKTRGDAASE